MTKLYTELRLKRFPYELRERIVGMRVLQPIDCFVIPRCDSDEEYAVSLEIRKNWLFCLLKKKNNLPT